MELNLWLIEKYFSDNTIMYWDITDTGMVWTDKPQHCWNERELAHQIHQISLNNELENITFRQLIRKSDFDALLNSHAILANHATKMTEERKEFEQKYLCLQDATRWLAHYVVGDADKPITTLHIREFCKKANRHDALQSTVKELEEKANYWLKEHDKKQIEVYKAEEQIRDLSAKYANVEVNIKAISEFLGRSDVPVTELEDIFDKVNGYNAAIQRAHIFKLELDRAIKDYKSLEQDVVGLKYDADQWLKVKEAYPYINSFEELELRMRLLAGGIKNE